MNETQSILLQMYKDVTSILSANNIQYYIHFGSAIGTVRHNGFVPWDDDMDILIRFEDFDRIGEILEKGLDPEKYYYHPPIGDSHPHVIYKGPDFENDLKNRKAIFIDLFEYRAYPNKKLRQILTNMVEFCYEGSVFVLDRVNSMVFYRCFKWAPRFFTGIMKRLVNKNTDLVVIYKPTRRRYVFSKSTFGEPIMHIFEDIEVPLYPGYDEVLKAIYGDYMTPPPEGHRSGASGFPCNGYKDYLLSKMK